MIFAKLAMLTLSSGLVAGCVTSGNYCDVARAIRPSTQDTLTLETERQILTENEKIQKLCGVEP